MRLWPVLVLVAVGLLVVPTAGLVGAHPSPSPPLAVVPETVTNIPAPAVVQTSTAGQTFYSTQVWNQTGTTVYGGHSNAWANFTYNPGGIITSAFTQTATFSVSAPGANVARVLVTQGSKTLANTTSNLFTVNPLVSATAVTERIVSLANATGAAPSVATYSCKTVVTESIQFDVVSASGNWSYNNTTYRTHWYVNASHGYWLNASTVSIPLVPNSQVNISSLSVTVNGSAATYQLTVNSAYVLLGPIPSGTSDAVNVSYRPVPTILGTPPTIYFSAFTDHDGLYTGEEYYTNYPVSAYDGLYILQLNFSGRVTNVTASGNGHAFTSSQMTVQGNRITILPGAFITYQSVQVLFLVMFNAVPVYPVIPGNSLSLFGSNATGYVTLGEVLGFAMLLSVLYLVYTVATMPGGYRLYGRRLFRRKTASRALEDLWKPLFVLLVIGVLFLIGTIPG